MNEFIKNYCDFNISKVKLIIWDLDDTLWSGIISEGEIDLSNANKSIIKQLAYKGIISSICSKNEFDVCKDKLISYGIWEYFVFPSISWAPKGERVKKIISDMQLRDVNVLYIDDDIKNLMEAKSLCQGLMVADPGIINKIIIDTESYEKEDKSLIRLNQYKVLERKAIEKESVSSNEEFLRSCNITVSMQKDCTNHLDRIQDVIMRSNQLNFTKIRSTLKQTEELLNDKNIDCGYVSVKDKFGDYGIIGFYALQNGKLLHFIFSCRTLGMGVEQYVYSELNFPEIEIVGEVVGTLNKKDRPDWINQNYSEHETENMKVLTKNKILLKGPCDIEQVVSFFTNKEMINCEFTYVSQTRGIRIESQNHSLVIMGAKEYDDETKKELIESIPFYDEKIFDTSFYSGEYSVVVWSTLVDYGLGVYKKNDAENEYVIFGQYTNPLTDKNKWNEFINGQHTNSGVKITKQFLEDFNSKYTFVGKINKEQFYNNLCYLREHLPKSTLLIFLNGTEIPSKKDDNLVYRDRHIVHKEMNAVLKEFCEKNENTYIIDVNKYVTEKSYIDNLNHYVKSVYYNIATELIEIIKRNNIENTEVKGRAFLAGQSIKQKLRTIKHKYLD